MQFTKKQAITIARSLVSGEKTKEDYGFAALKDAESALETMLTAIEFEESSTKKQKPRSPAITDPATPEVYDKHYPAIKDKRLEKLNKQMLKKVSTILDLEKGVSGE